MVVWSSCIQGCPDLLLAADGGSGPSVGLSRCSRREGCCRSCSRTPRIPCSPPAPSQQTPDLLATPMTAVCKMISEAGTIDSHTCLHVMMYVSGKRGEFCNGVSVLSRGTKP